MVYLSVSSMHRICKAGTEETIRHSVPRKALLGVKSNSAFYLSKFFMIAHLQLYSPSRIVCILSAFRQASGATLRLSTARHVARVGHTIIAAAVIANKLVYQSIFGPPRR